MNTTALRDVQLDDKYGLTPEPVLIDGNQALARALLMQHEVDRRAGLHTAGYAAGYRGSPVGGLDQTLWAARKALDRAAVTFAPGINEDLAATAIWGTQQLAVMGDAKVDGVYALWYGKGPGVDRSGDPFKHGNYSGTHPNGGVLVITGDDHPGKSSTIAHHSQQALAAHSIPVLYPADVSEFVPLALLGWAMSRYSGCWVGFKVVNETIEQTMTSAFDLDAFRIERPDPAGLMPPEGVHFRGVYAPVREEVIVRRHKLPLVQRFARANRLDRVVLGDAASARVGIVAAGKSWHDVRLALRALGIVDEARAKQLGVAVYKVALLWPLEPEGLSEFAGGLDELLFVEEKASFVEAQAAAILYNRAQRPRITGKTDASGGALLPSDVALEPLELLEVIAARLKACGVWDAALEQHAQAAAASRRVLTQIAAPTEVRRVPYFCSGCPHNTSTRIPEGSRALAGIGCSGMAVWARPGTMIPTQMGGEGVNWVGLHRYTTRQHVFQNLGDGTYYHSGLVAIRAAVASGANITYKILYNDAVAMTGGQPIDGPISVAAIAHQVLHEGVKRIVLVSDDPDKHRGTPLPAGVRIEHRDALDAVQRELRDTPGCTVLIYEQTCAAEKRRRRKRGEMVDPERRVVIHDAVCEGCGDCSAQSGCVSVEAKETPLGTKRRINQSSCNKDYSCLKGFCPSFVTVLGARPKRAAVVDAPGALFATLPLPQPAALETDGCYGVMIPGVGGTGVITVGAVLAMAAHLEGRAASTYDMTGLSQKNGAVYCHLQVADRPERLRGNRLGLGDASLVLGFDLVAALGDDAWRAIDPARTRFVGNHRVQPTAALAMGSAARLDFGLLARKVAEKLPAERVTYVDATGLATALLGDAIASNFFVVGVALQRGWLPLSVAAVERALELNGVQVDFNRRALNFGRLWAHDGAAIDSLLGGRRPAPETLAPLSLDELIADRAQRLTDYQDAAYAGRYRRLVDRVRAAERAAAGAEGAFSRAVAEQFARLLAYKDEYEVARLYGSPQFRAQLDAELDGVRELRLNLAPPLFARRDPATGHLIKREYGPWIFTAMRWLATARRWRGTALDIFGRTDERRMERALIGEYEARIEALLAGLKPQHVAHATEVAEVADLIRGFGHVKEANLKKARARWSELDAAPQTTPSALKRAA